MSFWNFLFGKNHDSETASEITPEELHIANSYSQKGVFITATHNSFIVSYSGTLAQQDTPSINLLVGYGDVNNWTNVTSYNMTKTNSKTFEVKIPRSINTNIHLAFSDDSNNWDNNNGQNYSFFC